MTGFAQACKRVAVGARVPEGDSVGITCFSLQITVLCRKKLERYIWRQTLGENWHQVYSKTGFVKEPWSGPLWVTRKPGRRHRSNRPHPDATQRRTGDHVVGGVWLASPQLRVGPGGGPAVDQVSVLRGATSAFSAGSEVRSQISPQTNKPDSPGAVVQKSVFSQAFR